MGFGDLRSSSGLQALNEYLASRSYVEGFTPSQADTAVFEALGAAPSADYIHALRWYNHISSYGGERNSFPGEKKPFTSDGARDVQPSDTAADDDLDLFGSDEEEDEETQRIKAERVAAYAAKKSTKPVLVAKSSIVLDVKPWDDETDMAALETSVRSVAMDGLVWGASKLVPVGYGIKKLQIMCVVEDDKVGIDQLEEAITAFEELVQSVDVHAFNKI